MATSNFKLFFLILSITCFSIYQAECLAIDKHVNRGRGVLFFGNTAEHEQNKPVIGTPAETLTSGDSDEEEYVDSDYTAGISDEQMEQENLEWIQANLELKQNLQRSLGQQNDYNYDVEDEYDNEQSAVSAQVPN